MRLKRTETLLKNSWRRLYSEQSEKKTAKERKMGLKTNVVKKHYRVQIEGIDESDLTRWMSTTDVWAESEEAAVLQIPKGIKVLEMYEVKESE